MTDIHDLRAHWPAPADAPAPGTNWLPPTQDATPSSDGTVPVQPVPGPTPAAPLTVPPAYRVWAPTFDEKPDPDAVQL